MNPDLRISNMAEWPPEATIFPVRAVDIRVSPSPHPFHLAHATQAADNWQQEIRINPALFDGQLVLQRAVIIRDGIIESEAHLVNFSTFLLWRRTKPAGAAVHLFGLPVILSSDGAVIAIRMGRHTANAGRVYCAAGSLDEGDVTEGRCDLARNMAREVREETGLDLADARADEGLYALHIDSTVTVFRIYRFAATAEKLMECIAAHIAEDPEPEADEALAIFSADPSLHTYPPFMPPILSFVFDR